jgi:hypothetical protein
MYSLCYFFDAGITWIIKSPRLGGSQLTPVSMDLLRPPGFTEEKMQRLRRNAPASMVADYFRLFDNRRAYTLQSKRPHPGSGRHYYCRATDRKTGQGLSLTMDTIRHHVGGEITVGLYAINPTTQCPKWVAIDAD